MPVKSNRIKMYFKKIFPRRIIVLLKKSIVIFKNFKEFFVKIFLSSTYIEQLQNIPTDKFKSEFYTDILQKQAIPSQLCPKIIAFYLPQYYNFYKNDLWWGRGFTEWTNVTKAIPQFIGHYQPHLPIDLGLYDLRVPATFARQVYLAKLYGIFGFCFYYYWFSGKRLLERPLFDFLKRSKIDFPFCLCWANEPWTRRWDGSNHEVLMQQKLLPGDDVQFVKDILPFVEDDRYIKIDEKPILIIYRPHLWTQSQVKSLLSGLQQNAKKYNFQFYFIMALTYDFSNDPREWGFSAGVEFPPHNFCSASYSEHITMFNKNFCGHIQDMRKLVKSTNSMERLSFTVFKTAFPNWDNTARRFNNGLIFNHSTPEIYKAWLKNNLLYTIKNNSKDEQFVFINAWNEWGEGAHLEPDRKFGYAYLQATADALASINCSNRTRT